MTTAVDKLRKPFFWIALVCMLLALLVDVGARLLITGETEKSEVQGLGIPYMALVDGLLLYVILISGLSLIIPSGIQGRVQGCVTLVISILVVLGGIVMIIAAFVLLLLMVTLVLAAPFGTIAYLAAFSDFPRGAAAATLSVNLFWKVLFVIFLVLAQQRFLANKSLVLLILTAIVANVLIGFLHGFVPGPFVSIADCLAALIVAIIGVIWAILFFLFSIPAVVKSVA